MSIFVCVFSRCRNHKRFWNDHFDFDLDLRLICNFFCSHFFFCLPSCLKGDWCCDCDDSSRSEFAGCEEGNQLLSKDEDSSDWRGGKHVWICVSKLQNRIADLQTNDRRSKANVCRAESALFGRRSHRSEIGASVRRGKRLSDAVSRLSCHKEHRQLRESDQTVLQQEMTKN